MKCPYCQKEFSQVIDSEKRDGTTVRRRECLECKNRFSTVEIDLVEWQRFRKVEELLVMLNKKLP